ncbi:MAG: hypothetical protein ACLVB5_09010 [Christensenellales bacterium]
MGRLDPALPAQRSLALFFGQYTPLQTLPAFLLLQSFSSQVHDSLFLSGTLDMALAHQNCVNDVTSSSNLAKPSYCIYTNIALSANERIAEFLDFAIQAKFAYVNKLSGISPFF